MKEVLVRIKYDPDYLSAHGLDLEQELQGWLTDSAMEVVSITPCTTQED